MFGQTSTHISLLRKWPEALVALDKNQCVSVVSQGAKNILGKQDKVYLGKHVHDALCVETRNLSHNKEDCPVCKRIQENNGSEFTSAWWKNTQGDNISLDYHVMHPDNLGGIKYLISFIDNHQRSHNQEELDKFAEYIDKTPSPIAELDHDAVIVFANSAMNKMLVEHGFSETGHALVLPHNIKVVCSRCITEKRHVECVEVNQGGSVYSWNFYPLSSSSNTVLAWMNDISEKKRMEETIQGQQSAARRDFFAKMVHELRTPINAIVGFSNLLLVGDTDKYNKEELDMLERIYHGGLELSDLISDTLDASKIEAGKMDLTVSQFNLNKLIEQAYDHLRGVANDKALEFSFICDSSIEIRSDKNKIKQILSNLLSNAIKYTENGHISLAVKERSSNSIDIIVTDTGLGMKEKDLSKLFESYERIGETRSKELQGTGLGLALVKELITMLNGEIKVESVFGEGSTFTIMLPTSID